MTPSGPAEEEDYFQEIERRFSLLRGRPLFLSPRDAALVDRWWRAGVPLRVVIEAVESVFEKRGGGGAVHSLSYCRHAVEEAFAEWRESRLGGREAAAPDAPPAPDAILEDLGRVLRERMAAVAVGEEADALRRAGEEVGALLRRCAGEGPPARAEVERELETVEARLLDALLAALPAAERGALEAAVEAETGPAGAGRPPLGRPPEIAARLRAAIRERHALPRLTLY